MVFRDGRSPKYPLILVGVASAILLIGFLLKPGKPAPSPAPSGPELARLQALAQRKRLRDIGDYLADVANMAAGRLVYVFERNASGLLWHDGRIVSDWIPNGGPLTVGVAQVRGASTRATRCPSVAGAGFSCLQPAAGALRLPGIAQPREPNPGDWVLAVAADGASRTRLAQGLFESSAKVACSGREYQELHTSATLDHRFAGGGLFDLDGNLLGPIIRCGERFAAVSADSFAGVYSIPVPTIDRIEQNWGFRVLPSTPEKRATALTVAVVWSEGAAYAAGLQPGDMILSISGRASETENDLGDVLLAPHVPAAVALSVQRGKRVISLSLQRGVQPETAAVSPVGIEVALQPAISPGTEIREVRPDSPAAQVGLRQGDRIIGPDIRTILAPKRNRSIAFEFSRNGQPARAVLYP
jgi:S1-C subfamily serine protease